MAGKAFVFGAGSGEVQRGLARQGVAVSTVAFPGETYTNLPGHIYYADGLESAPLVVSRAYGSPSNVVCLPDTAFYDAHPVADDIRPLRDAFAKEFYTLVVRRPYDQGDDIIDGIQGAYNLASSAKRLLRAPLPADWTHTDAPALCIAAGPSLSDHLDAIRALQGSCLIIACDSALEGLLAAGITPHLVTPFERVPEVATESFPRDHYDGIIFAGNPVVHPSIAAKFSRHLLLPGSDILYTWAGMPLESQLFLGQSTGVLGAMLATKLTSGPIYLIGHDLAFASGKSHFDGVHHGVQISETGDMMVAGNAGEPVKTTYWWDVFRRELSDVARTRKNVVNCNIAGRRGAVIPFAIDLPLPVPGSLPDLVLPEMPPPNDARYESFARRVRKLPSDAQSILARLSFLRPPTADDVDMRTLCRTENRVFFSYILRSVFAQFSLDHHSGMPDAKVFAGMAEAMRIALRECRGLFQAMADEV